MDQDERTTKPMPKVAALPVGWRRANGLRTQVFRRRRSVTIEDSWPKVETREYGAPEPGSGGSRS
jgi:hypothetical protein